jgi:hypothetical protein
MCNANELGSARVITFEIGLHVLASVQLASYVQMATCKETEDFNTRFGCLWV